MQRPHFLGHQQCVHLVWHGGFVLGVIEPGESREQALVREVREEFGIALAPGRLASAMLVTAPAHGLDNTELHMHCYTGPATASPSPPGRSRRWPGSTPATRGPLCPGGSKTDGRY
ncbi:NUDIX domain-containing protein [Streptomyces platensis]|uniref:NUDIX domain-containing protein n=1 Tax=Streptomyces platensis TaxID=58346 RepID=UPI003C2CB41A